VRLGQVDVPDFIACTVRDVVRQVGGSEWIAMGIVSAESGFRAGALGDRAAGPDVVVGGITYHPYFDVATGNYYCSLGLLQLNLCGGQGAGYPVTTLLDARGNMLIGQRPIAIAEYAATLAGWTGERYIREVARRSGHPGFVALDDSRLTAIYNATVRLITDSRGNIVAWPPHDPRICAGTAPPPPPLGTWCEPFAATDSARADALIERHHERIAQLGDAFG
jgi:hypothetical protein